jgi:excinuclease UvrABC helicase subunit UvrB
MKNTSLRQTMVSGYNKINSVTIKDLEKKIQNIVGANSRHYKNCSDDEADYMDGNYYNRETTLKTKMTAKIYGLKNTIESAIIQDSKDCL